MQGTKFVKNLLTFGAASLAIAGLALATPAQARHYRHHHDRGHGNCLRFNKTTGSVAGAVGGGLLGNAIIGGTGGTLLGAAAGGVAGHELSHNRRKRC
jgi:osmotically inducible lipoprotein OsmB